MDLATGKRAKLPRSIAGRYQLALDRHGNFYGYGGWKSNVVLRYDRDGKPLPFKATGTNKLRVPAYARGPSGVGLRGLAVGPTDRVYAIANDKAARLFVYEPDGSAMSSNLVPGMASGDCSVGADAAGNVYLGLNLRPENRVYPPEFAGLLPGAEGQGPANWWWWHDAVKGNSNAKGERPVPWEYSYYNPYLWHWGAVFKFGPGGGRIYRGKSVATAPETAVKYKTGYLSRIVAVRDARWRYAGFGICPSGDAGWGDPACVCYNARFAVDPYGRVFLPNPFRFCVEIVDTSGNRLARVGRYGNADSAGPGSRVPEPAIALAFPYAIDVDDRRIYVTDFINDRLAVIELSYAAQATCAVE